MPLIKLGKVVADEWSSVSPGEEIPASGPVLVALDVWREHREALIARGTPLGVRLASDQPPSEIANDLSHFSLVALDFPAFTDGRAYSYARLLRERHGFEGEIRAVGNVLLEQLHYMQRVGFDAFELDSDHPLDDWLIANEDLHVWYQPTSDGRRTAMSQRKLH